MWLLRVAPFLARAAVRTYYRFEAQGSAVPPAGPVLLLANHPNALLDPAVVVTAAGRPVRFLAKSTLFEIPLAGKLVQSAGAIPVYRRTDDPSLASRNVEAFEAVFDALAADAAVGIFPEGLSHGEPALVPLKTGAARMALGFAIREGRTFPIVPVGLVFRDKTAFRSEALALRGAAVDWDDLAGRNVEDREAVEAFTRRLDTALRRLTVNTESWEDRPLVEGAEAVWAAEFGAPLDPTERVARLERTTEILAHLRRDGPEGAWRGLARRIGDHVSRLRGIGLEPADLAASDAVSTALRHAVRNLGPLFPITAGIAAAGWTLFWLPYRLTGFVADRFRPSPEMQSTTRVLVGAVVYVLWVAALALGTGLAGGILAGLFVLAAVPAIGLAGLRIRERWQGAWRDVRRFLRLRSRTPLLESLREDQRILAADLDGLRDE